MATVVLVIVVIMVVFFVIFIVCACLCGCCKSNATIHNERLSNVINPL